MGLIYERFVKYQLLFPLFAVPLVICTSTSYLYSPKFPLLQFSGAAALAAWAAGLRGGKACTGKTPLDAPVIIFLVWTGLSAFWAHNKYLSVEWFVALATLVSLYFVASRARLSIKAVAVTVTIAAGIISIYGLFQAAGHDFLAEPSARPVSFIGNVNFAGEFIAPVIILTFGMIVKSGTLKAKIFYIAIIFIQLIYLAITNAKGAWLGLLSGAALFGILLPGAGARSARITVYCLVLALSGLLLWVLAAGGGLLDDIAFRMHQYAGMSHVSVRSRLDIWTVASRMIRDNPVLGTGAGNFYIAYPAYSNVGEFGVIGEHAQVNFAHNDFIQVASDLGAPGLAVFGWVLVAAGRIVRRKARRMDVLEVGVAAGIFCIMVSSFFGFPLETPSTAMLFWVWLGLLSSGEANASGKEISRGMRMFIKPASLAFLVSVTLFSGAALLSDYHLNRGRALAERGEWETAEREIKKSASYYYPNTGAGAMLAAVYLNKGDAERAYEYLGKTLDKNPNHRWANGVIGQLYLESGRFDRAVEHIEKSVRLRPSLYLGLAEAYYLAGDREKAMDWIRKQIRLGAANEYSYFYLGVLSEEKGEKETAARAYREALRIRPGFELAAEQLAALGE